MDILIIGGTGVLSSAVVNVALKQGLKVTMINRGRRKNTIQKELMLLWRIRRIRKEFNRS